MSDEYVSPPVTDEQKKLFEALTGGEFTNFAALSGKFKNENVIYIVAVNEEGGGYTMQPVAILIDDAFLEKFGLDMQDPTGVVPEHTPTVKDGT